MASDKPKPNKESLQVELNSLLTTAHGEIKEAADKIATALDALIHNENANNKKLFVEAVTQAMTIPNSSHFMSADKEVKQAMVEILQHAGEVLDLGLRDLAEANREIIKQKKKLKERIQEIEQETTRRHRL